jgi:hypothetical protein
MAARGLADFEVILGMKKKQSTLFFRSGLQNLIFRCLHAYLLTIFEFDYREASLTSGQYSLEILKVNFDWLPFVIFEFH